MILTNGVILSRLNWGTRKDYHLCQASSDTSRSTRFETILDSFDNQKVPDKGGNPFAFPNLVNIYEKYSHKS